MILRCSWIEDLLVSRFSQCSNVSGQESKAEICAGALLGLIPLVLGLLFPGYSASMSLQRIPVYKTAPDNQLPEDRVPFVFLTVVSSVLTAGLGT